MAGTVHCKPAPEGRSSVVTMKSSNRLKQVPITKETDCSTVLLFVHGHSIGLIGEFLYLGVSLRVV